MLMRIDTPFPVTELPVSQYTLFDARFDMQDINFTLCSHLTVYRRYYDCRHI